MSAEIDTSNDYLVGMLGDDLAFLLPLPSTIPKDKALRLAAWIVAMTDRNDEFPAILEAVCNT